MIKIAKKINIGVYREKIEGNNSGCILLSDKPINRKLKIKCKCGSEFERHTTIILNGKYPYCKKCCNKIITQGLKLNFEDLVKETLETSNCQLVGGEYKNLRSKLTFKCNCGETFDTSWDEFKNNNKKQCNQCSGLKRESYDSVKDFINNNSKLELISNEYIGLHEKLVLKCECGEIFEATFREVRDRGVVKCSKCRKSKSNGEIVIKEVLDNLNIKYLEQYYYNDCKNIRPLPFDFYIPDYNLLIEVDGIQHLRPFSFNGNLDNFGDRVYNDAIKNSYCEDNDINLLRIYYNELKIARMIIENKIKQIC